MQSVIDRIMEGSITLPDRNEVLLNLAKTLSKFNFNHG